MQYSKYNTLKKMYPYALHNDLLFVKSVVVTFCLKDYNKYKIIELNLFTYHYKSV